MTTNRPRQDAMSAARRAAVMRGARLSRVAAVAALTLTFTLPTQVAPVVHAQTRPPAIVELSQYGLPRGVTTTVVVTGQNLQDADRVLFDDERIVGRIVSRKDLGPDVPRRAVGQTDAPITDIARKIELAIEVDVPAGVTPGPHGFRLRTPLGTTALRTVVVGILSELDETELNDEPREAQAMTLPMTVNGALQRGGDVDHFQFDAKAGQQLVFALAAAPLGSRLDSTLTLLDSRGDTVATNDDSSWQMRDSVLVHTFAQDGRYVLRVADALNGGGPRDFHYRVSAGELPYVTSLFPLGGARDQLTRFTIDGIHLDGPSTAAPRARIVQLRLSDSRETTARAAAAAAPSSRPVASVSEPIPGTARVLTASQTDTLPLTLQTANGPALNDRRVARGSDPEIVETEALTGAATGQLVTLPLTINGRLAARADGSSADTFRVRARKGERIVLAIAAERLGSPLDAVLDVLDARGRPVPRILVRPVWETTVDLRDRSSVDPGLRLLATSALRRGDYIFVDRELMRVRELPKSPDEDVQLMQFRGRRFSYEGTSGESHANTRPVYRVELHPPGTALSPNGLPTFTVNYRNDDGGPLYGKDPYLEFTAPADGTYLVRVSDAREQGGRDFAYRLTMAPPRPDFTLFVAPTNPNVPRGSRVPVTVTAYRHDGFDGPIDVKLAELPAGLTATTGVIAPGHTSVALTLEASDDAPMATAPFHVVADARIADRTVRRTADLERALPLVSVTNPPDVRVVSVEPATIELEPGKRATVQVKIARSNGFAGRVPLNVLNLPFRVTIPDTGLNGILITEQQEGRTFIIEADPAAAPMEQTLYVTARAEVNSGEPTERASTPITLRIVPAAGTPTAAAMPSTAARPVVRRNGPPE